MERLNSLDAQFAEMAEKVENIDLVLDPRNPESLLRAENDLGRIIGELERLQHLGMQESTDGTANMYDALGADIGELLQQTRLLQEQIRKSVPSHLRQRDIEPEDASGPLTRDEIAKLLLVVSRAFSIAQISAEQRSFIKDEICKKKSYLRDVLQAEDIFAVMGTLATLRPNR